jgi:hypothetical protein
MMSNRCTMLGAAALAGLSIGVPAASADTNGPTTRDCSLLVPAIGSTFAGVDPDFIQLSGVSVGSSGALTATRNPVSLEASESPDPGDSANTVSFKATVSTPGTASRSFSGTAVGRVVLSLPLKGAAPGSSYTISWSATFDNGFHPCPGALTPANPTPSPFVVRTPRHRASRRSR